MINLTTLKMIDEEMSGLTDGEKHYAGLPVEKKLTPDQENLIVAQQLNVLLVDIQFRGESLFSKDDAAKFAKIMGILRP